MTEQKGVHRLGDGSCLCEDCWKREYPDTPEPVYGWEAGYCTGCQVDCEDGDLTDVPGDEDDDYRMYLQDHRAGSGGQDQRDYDRQIEMLDSDGLAEIHEWESFISKSK